MIEDLSGCHEPVTNLFRLPRSTEEWMSHRLTDEQVEFYRTQGYLAGVRVLTDEQVDVFRSEPAALFDPKHEGLAGDMEAEKEVLTGEQRAEFKPVAIELKKGEASFHHPLMVHGSYENRTTHPRRAAVINVFRDGVRSASDGPLLEGVPPIPNGQPMEGRFFPLLFDPSVLRAGDE